MAPHLRRRATVIDKESERAVTGWLRLGDSLSGRKPTEGKCDGCGRTGYVSVVTTKRLCAKCYLEGKTAGS